eukprot:gene10841-12654_t
MADDRDGVEALEVVDETRRNNRMMLKEVCEDMKDSKQEMKNVHSTKFASLLKRYENVAKGLVDPNTNELMAGATCVRQLTDAVKGQAQTLSDVSTRLSLQDLSTSVTNRFGNDEAIGGLNWANLGNEARQLFNSTPSFNTLVGPLNKEERQRNITVRRHRENTADVINATSENIENNESDGNDEATNARVTHLLKHIESHENQEFDLLKTLVDPVNPVQSLENFFDFSYLHKEKKVKHKFDEETGTLKACAAKPKELDEAPKSQMVLSFNMQDLARLAQLVHPEAHITGADSVANSSQVSHPLHREDPLYDAHDAQEQVRILAERTAQQKAQKKAAGGTILSDTTSVSAHNVHSSQTKTRSRTHSSSFVEQNPRTTSECNVLDGMLPNGSCSSRYNSVQSSLTARQLFAARLASTPKTSSPTNPLFSPIPGKRVLDLEELKKTDPLTQGSMKRRADDATPSLPRTTTPLVTMTDPRGQEDMQLEANPA